MHQVRVDDMLLINHRQRRAAWGLACEGEMDNRGKRKSKEKEQTILLLDFIDTDFFA